MRLKTMLIAWLLLITLAPAGSVWASTFNVTCGGTDEEETLTTISAALARASFRGEPTVINVTGPCSENVTVHDLDAVTITTSTGASITDPTGGAKSVFDIQRSHDISISNLTISAPPLAGSGITAGNGYAAVSCQFASSCFLTNNSITSGTGDGVFVARGSNAEINGGTVSNNVGRGIVANFGSRAGVTGVTLNNNGGATGSAQIRLYSHSSLLLRFSSVTNNTSYFGVRLTDHSSAEFGEDVISGNVSGGVSLEGGSEAAFYAVGTGTSITGNQGGGVLIWDVSLANFWGPGETGTSATDNVSGNGVFDLNCETGHAFAIGALPLASLTNCKAP